MAARIPVARAARLAPSRSFHPFIPQVGILPPRLLIRPPGEEPHRLDSGYEDFKVGVLLRQAREKAGLTQEEVARRLDTQKSAISRIENHAGDIRFSTLERYA